MSICSKIKNNIIEKPIVSINDFKNSFLKNNYDENMFNNDGSLNANFNSKKKTGIIACKCQSFFGQKCQFQIWTL